MILILVGLAMVGIAYFGKVKKKDMIMGIGVVIAAGGFLAQAGVINLQSLSGTTTTSGTGAVVSGVSGVPVNTLTLVLSEKYSNSLGNVDGAFLGIYPEGTDPQDPNAVALTTASFVDGKVTLSDKLVQVGKAYKVIIDGNSTFYSEDLGNTVLVEPASYNVQTGDAVIDFASRGIQVVNVGTISDMVDELTNATTIDGGSWFSNSTETACVGTYNAAELMTHGADALCYDDSIGDGSYYFSTTFDCTGANEECRNMALCFVNDLTNPVEGNEYSQITVSKTSGDDRGLPTDVTNAFKNEQCLALGNWKAGTSAVYKFTFTVTEGNTDDGADLFNMYLADLGKNAGRDIGQEVGATDDSVQIGHVA